MAEHVPDQKMPLRMNCRTIHLPKAYTVLPSRVPPSVLRIQPLMLRVLLCVPSMLPRKLRILPLSLWMLLFQARGAFCPWASPPQSYGAAFPTSFLPKFMCVGRWSVRFAPL